LEFTASAEVYQPASAGMRTVRQYVGPFLNAAFSASSLANLDCKLRYTPIIMPEGMCERYPARSKLHKKERVYDCSPQLDYEMFVEGSFEDHLREYLRGIALSAPHLAGLGASKEQVEDFEKIMATAAESILAERPDQTRH